MTAPTDVRCPVCGARIGAPCLSPRGAILARAHYERRREVAGGRVRR